MKYSFPCISAVLLIASTLSAQQIKDVPLTDSGYPAVSSAVKMGYLPLSSDNTFQSDQAVSRKEMAIILDKLLSGESKADLTKVQIQELLGLSKSFKAKVVQFEKIQTDLTAAQSRLDDDQKAIHGDISRLTEQLSSANATIEYLKINTTKQASGRNIEIEKLKNESSDQHSAMWVAIGLSLILGIIK